MRGPPGRIAFAARRLRRAGARRGAARPLHTAHGSVETPAFVGVGTQATVKSVDPSASRDAGTQVLFANTYHLYLRPGAERVAAHGGVHRFMGWDRPIMTDSGGFQVFSLGASIDHGVGKVASIFPGDARPRRRRRRPRLSAAGGSMVEVGEDEVRFRSHVDGSLHVFTPEVSVRVQRLLGADVMLAFDECTSPLHDEATRALERPHAPLGGALPGAFEAEPPRHGYEQLLFGVVQGGAFEGCGARAPDDRRHAVRRDGRGRQPRPHPRRHAPGAGVDRAGAPRPLPRHLLGIGDVPSVLAAVARGIDTFDCVAPTRNARNGGALARSTTTAGRCRTSGSTCATPASPTTCAPSRPTAAAPPAGASRAPTCATCSRPTSRSGRSS
jgi:queuine tRNA-ribosyltransferase